MHILSKAGSILVWPSFFLVWSVRGVDRYIFDRLQYNSQLVWRTKFASQFSFLLKKPCWNPDDVTFVGFCTNEHVFFFFFLQGEQDLLVWTSQQHSHYFCNAVFFVRFTFKKWQLLHLSYCTWPYHDINNISINCAALAKVQYIRIYPPSHRVSYVPRLKHCLYTGVHTCVGVDTIIGFYHNVAHITSTRSGRQITRGRGGGRGAGGDSCSQSDGQSGGVVAPRLPLLTKGEEIIYIIPCIRKVFISIYPSVPSQCLTFLWKTSPNSRRCCRKVSNDSLMPSTE